MYDEAGRVALIISGPGVAAGTVDRSHLVYNGLDLVPTICDYAGADIPDDLKGKSLRSLAEGKDTDSWRKGVVVENEIGKAAVTLDYKYARYDEGTNPEQLVDLKKDPGEMKNVAGEDGYSDVVKMMRGEI